MFHFRPRFTAFTVAICTNVINAFVESLYLKGFLRGLDGEAVNHAIEDGYKELMEKDFISDPIVEGGLAILGFVPFSITKKTGKGQEAHLRVRALL